MFGSDPVNHKSDITASDARAQAVRIKMEKAERRGEEWPRPAARIAECPEHGLHGERLACFECQQPVRRPLYLHATTCAALIAGSSAVAFLLGVWL